MSTETWHDCCLAPTADTESCPRVASLQSQLREAREALLARLPRRKAYEKTGEETLRKLLASLGAEKFDPTGDVRLWLQLTSGAALQSPAAPTSEVAQP